MGGATSCPSSVSDRSGPSPARPFGETGPDRRGEFEALLVPILPRAYAAARYLTRGTADAEDLVQEAALLAWRGFDGFREGTNFRAWFLRILTNTHYSRLRRQRRAAPTASLDDVPDLYLYRRTREAGWHDDDGDPARTFLGKLDTERVERAIEALPDEYRAVAALYFVDDLSYKEIAEAVARPVGTVRSRLHRGRKLLQSALWEVALEHGIVPSSEEGE